MSRFARTLKNADHALLPGMYATVDIAASAPEHHVTLPATAITYNSFGNTVFLVDDQGKDADGHPKLMVRQVFVRPARPAATRWRYWTESRMATQSSSPAR